MRQLHKYSMDQEYNTYAYFWIEGFDCEPWVISDLLGLQPTRTFKKGDLISDKGDKRRKTSVWEYCSTLPRTEPCQDAHISNLLEVLLQRKETIIELKSKYDMGINCVGYYHNANPGFNMSAELINSCSEIGISIDFDLYTVGIIEVDEVNGTDRVH